ncbi:hypothetical protein [Sphingomonas sp. Leaf5]|uniref:hypothetical protein n=1 Tax=Sphingomonas sp. Leaf5 TaxID=1735671 RepID=UPI0012E0EDB1|nr:hypothetical protein [Sphingomonas sp. Leaf5]
MTIKSQFEYVAQAQADGTTLHTFVGTSYEWDWPALSAFCSQHRMKGSAWSCGVDEHGAFEECEVYTTDPDVAMLFKLTWVGA